MKDGKLFGKIHILDVIVIIAAIAVFVTAIGRFSGTEIINFGTGSAVTIRYQVTTGNYDPIYFERLTVGDVLAEDKRFLDGKIVDVEFIDSPVTLVDNNGDRVTGINPVLKKAVVTIEAVGETKGAVYKVGGQEIREGLPHFIVTQYNNLSGIVSDIEILD